MVNHGIPTDAFETDLLANAVKGRVKSLDLGRRANSSTTRIGGTQNPDSIIVNTTRSSGQATPRKSRSPSLSSQVSGESSAVNDLVRRKGQTYSNGDNRYIPYANCTETGIWDTHPPGRCKTKQDDIDAANKAEKDARINKAGIIATSAICGTIVLGGAGYGLHRCLRRR